MTKMNLEKDKVGKTEVLTVPPPPPPLLATPAAPSVQVRVLVKEFPGQGRVQDVAIRNPQVLLRPIPHPLGQELVTPYPGYAPSAAGILCGPIRRQ